jgi:hypothetical protein
MSRTLVFERRSAHAVATYREAMTVVAGGVPDATRGKTMGSNYRSVGRRLGFVHVTDERRVEEVRSIDGGEGRCETLSLGAAPRAADPYASWLADRERRRGLARPPVRWVVGEPEIRASRGSHVTGRTG